jgi:hypothetical protein
MSWYLWLYHYQFSTKVMEKGRKKKKKQARIQKDKYEKKLG